MGTFLTGGAQTGSIAHLSDCQPSSPAQPPLLCLPQWYKFTITTRIWQIGNCAMQWEGQQSRSQSPHCQNLTFLTFWGREVGDALTNRAELFSACCTRCKLQLYPVHFSQDTGYRVLLYSTRWFVVLGDCGGGWCTCFASRWAPDCLPARACPTGPRPQDQTSPGGRSSSRGSLQQ